MRYAFLWILIFAAACTKTNVEPEVPIAKPEPKIVEKKMTRNKTPDKKGTQGRIITAQIVRKSFMKKNGKKSSHTELYVRRSIQDYFIKFCESKVSREDIEKAIEDHGETLSLEIEIKKGNWDICDEEQVQSRGGDYIVIHKING